MSAFHGQGAVRLQWSSSVIGVAAGEWVVRSILLSDLDSFDRPGKFNCKWPVRSRASVKIALQQQFIQHLSHRV